MTKRMVLIKTTLAKTSGFGRALRQLIYRAPKHGRDVVTDKSVRGGQLLVSRVQNTVCFFVNEFPSVSQTFVLAQVTGLIDRGWDVTIVARKPGSETVRHSDVAKYELLRRTTYLSPWRSFFGRKAWRVRCFGKALVTHPVLLMSEIGKLLSGKSVSSLGSIVEDLAVDRLKASGILYAHFGTNGVTALRMRRAGIVSGPLVVVFHGVDVARTLKRSATAYHDVFRECQLCLPISQKWQNKLLEAGCPSHKLLVHHMGVDTTSFRTVSTVKSHDNAYPTIVSIARLTEKKGIRYAINALSRLKERTDFQYLIIGDGPLRSDLQSFVSSNGLSHMVTFNGALSHSEIRSLMPTCDILLAPSVTATDGDQEGIPVAIMEAMASGLPVVATDHSGIPELVVDGRSGILVPERDVEQLERAIERLVDSSELRQTMGREGQKIVERDFDLEKLNNQLSELLKGLTTDEHPWVRQ